MSSSSSDQTTRRQITHEERDMLVDMNLTKAAGELGIDSSPTFETWVKATEHVNRAVALMKEPQARLKIAVPPDGSSAEASDHQSKSKA